MALKRHVTPALISLASDSLSKCPLICQPPPSSRSGTQRLDAQRKSEDKVLTCGHVTKMWVTQPESVSCAAVEIIPNTAQSHPSPIHPLPSLPLCLAIMVHFGDLRRIPLPLSSATWDLRASLLPCCIHHSIQLSQ